MDSKSNKSPIPVTHPEEKQKTPPIEKEKEKEKEGTCSLLCTSFCQLALQGLLGYLAYIVSTRPKYFGDPLQCYELRTWTYNYAILNFYVMGWDTFCLTVTMICNAFDWNGLLKFTRTLNSILYPFIFLLYIACFILLTVFFCFWETCGKCRTFVFIMILSFWVSVTLFFVNMGCSSAFCKHAITGLYERRFEVQKKDNEKEANNAHDQEKQPINE